MSGEISKRCWECVCVCWCLCLCWKDSHHKNHNNNNNNNNVPETVVRASSLSNVDGTPSATGSVSIRTGADGKRFIYLGTDFAQEMGPGDTEVRLAMGGGNAGEQLMADANSVSPSLGIIANGSEGEQLFEIPSSVDDTTFSHVIIWCPTAGVNFGVAEFGGGGSGATFTGTLANVMGTPSATGAVTITETSAGNYTITLGADFAQEMGPGDTEIRLAKGDGNVAEQIMADAANVSSSLGIITNGASGTMTFDFSGSNPADFSHIIIWCPTAGVNFGAGAISGS